MPVIQTRRRSLMSMDSSGRRRRTATPVNRLGEGLERGQRPAGDRPGEEPIDERGEARQPGRELVLDRDAWSRRRRALTGSMRQVTSIPLVAPATWTKRRRRVAGSDQVRERQVTGSPSPRTPISGR